MRKKTIILLATATLCCSALFTLSSCTVTEDKPVITPPTEAVQLKQGVWTEHDTALEGSDKYTAEELEQMPAVGMMVDGDKGYFFTYTAEGASDLVEGNISYNKDSGKGTITFPAITGSPISGQTVSFNMISDETMEFEFTYEGQKTTGTCAWLCDNLDNWGTGDESDWEELLPYYQAIAETAGPDGSIDWSGSETVTVEDVDEEGNIVEKEVTVTDLDKPLVWDAGSKPVAKTRMVTAVIEGISAGLEIFTSLFEPDPMEEINAKLDAALGKLDNVLQNQQVMNAKLDKINAILVGIAQKMNQQETVNIFNTRNADFYNKLKVQNIAYFNKAFKLYNDNKSNLGSVKDKLGEYAKEWVGNNEEYINLTWNYIEYLNTVQHSSYGTGMAAIYDGLTFDKYPWEHMGTGDRQNYRANDMIMIAKCLFMINLYAAYGGGSDIKKEGIYNNYNEQKPKLKEFCEFKVTNPDKFLVCQIPGAHFIMHKELQKYKFSGANNKAPHPDYCGGHDAVYRPEWHEAGSVKVENPAALKSKLFSFDEIFAIHDYYKSAVYPNQNNISWKNMLVDGNEIAGGAVFAKQPTTANDDHLRLLLNSGTNYMGAFTLQNGSVLGIIPSVGDSWLRDIVIRGVVHMGTISGQYWSNYNSNLEYYAAIVEKRY